MTHAVFFDVDFTLIQLGMRAVLVARSGQPAACPADVPVIHSLRALPALL